MRRIDVWEIECLLDVQDDLPDVQFALDIPDGVHTMEVAGEDKRFLTAEEAQLTVGFPLVCLSICRKDKALSSPSTGQECGPGLLR